MIMYKTFLRNSLSISIFILCLSNWGQEQSWKINLKNADIRDFISQVATITNETFVIDPRVKGNVTIVSDQSLDAESVYSLFLSVLRVHGYGATRTGNVVRIVQNSVVKQSGSATSLLENVNPGELVTRVISAQNVNADELVKILRPMIPQYGHIAGVSTPNVVIISDHADNINRLISVIQQIDVADEDDVIVVPLSEAWVGGVVTILEQVAPDQIGSSAKGPQRVLVIANERNNTIVLRGKPSPTQKIRTLIEQLDQPASTNGSTRVFQLNHADALSTAEILNGLAPSNQTGSGNAKKPTSTFIQADESLNAIIARADPSYMNEIEDVIRQLDIRRAQVLIEAAIVEVSIDNLSALGVEMAAADSRGKSAPIATTTLNGIINKLIASATTPSQLTDAGQANQEINPLNAIGTASSPTLAIAKLDPESLSFGAIINALATDTSADLLSTPSVLTLDNEEAKILVGQEVPFRTGSFTTSNNGASNPFTTIQRENVGVELTVTPHIHEDSSVRLEILQTVENVVDSGLGIGEAGFSDVVTNKRSIETTILADNRQTIVLGGLIQADIRETIMKVPLLGDIPLIGTLFSNSSINRTKRHLLVFLKPTVQRTEEEIATTTTDKYNRIWSIQIESRKKGSTPPPIDQLYEGRSTQ